MSSPNPEKGPTLDKADYERRKHFLEDMKILSKDEYEEIFRILKRHNIEYSENSNGIFFDLALLSSDVFEKLSTFMDFCKTQRKIEEVRLHEMDVLREETKDAIST
jgi:hypothetical protein